MTLTIELEPALEARLQEESNRNGVQPREYAKRLIEENLPPPLNDRQKRMLDLLDEWDREDATDDPGELSRRETDWEEFKAALNESRRQSGARILFP